MKDFVDKTDFADGPNLRAMDCTARGKWLILSHDGGFTYIRRVVSEPSALAGGEK